MIRIIFSNSRLFSFDFWILNIEPICLWYKHWCHNFLGPLSRSILTWTWSNVFSRLGKSWRCNPESTWWPRSFLFWKSGVYLSLDLILTWSWFFIRLFNKSFLSWFERRWFCTLKSSFLIVLYLISSWAKNVFIRLLLKSFTCWTKELLMFWNFFHFETTLICSIMTRSWSHTCALLSSIKVFLLNIFLCKCSSWSLLWLIFHRSSLNFWTENWTLFILINWECLHCCNIISSRPDILLNILLKSFNAIFLPLQRFSFFWSNDFRIILTGTDWVSSFSFEFDLVICMSFKSSVFSFIIAKLKVMWRNWRRSWFLGPF